MNHVAHLDLDLNVAVLLAHANSTTHKNCWDTPGRIPATLKAEQKMDTMRPQDPTSYLRDVRKKFEDNSETHETFFKLMGEYYADT
jgi:hypothetical protein